MKDMETKICSSCKIEKSTTEYYKNLIECKKCHNTRDREYHKKHRTEILERQHKRLETHREENKQKCKENYLRNRKERMEKMREYYKKNHKELLEINRQYQQEHYIEILESNRQYRKTEPGRKSSLKHYDKRKRGLGSKELFSNILDTSECPSRHHINNDELVWLPRDIHFLYGTRPTEEHRIKLSFIVEQLYPEIKLVIGTK